MKLLIFLKQTGPESSSLYYMLRLEASIAHFVFSSYALWSLETHHYDRQNNLYYIEFSD